MIMCELHTDQKETDMTQIERRNDRIKRLMALFGITYAEAAHLHYVLRNLVVKARS